MKDISKNLIYKENASTEFTFRRAAKHICFYLGRRVVYLLIHTYEFLAKAPVAETFAYCKLLELNHRIDAVYLKMMKDVKEEDAQARVTKIYKSLRGKTSDLQRDLYNKKLVQQKTIEKINTLYRHHQSENMILQKMGNEVIASYMENFDKDLNEQEEWLNHSFKELQKKVSPNQLPTLDEMVSIFQFINLADLHLGKLHELREKGKLVSHPDVAYALREGFKKIKEENSHFITLLNLTPLPIEDENKKNEIQVKTLKAFISKRLGFPTETKVPQAEQLFTIISDHQNIEGLERFNFRIKICDHLILHKKRYFPIDTQPQDIVAYLKKMMKHDSIPGVLELQALAEIRHLKLRLFSHLLEKGYQDYGSKIGDPDLHLFLDNDGNILKLSK